MGNRKGTMELPEFVRRVINENPTYNYLQEDTWAALRINSVVAFLEEMILKKSLEENWDWNSLDWHAEALTALDREGFLPRDFVLPPSWKRCITYVSGVVGVCGFVVVHRAKSTDQLAELPGLLEDLVLSMAQYLFQSKIEQWHDVEKLEQAFASCLSSRAASAMPTFHAQCWKSYRRRVESTMLRTYVDPPSDLEVIAMLADPIEDSVSARPLPPANALPRAEARKRVVKPLLTARKWSPNKWGSEAGVGKNCPYEYLKGMRSLTQENRKAMAEALGLTEEQLPND